MHDSTSDEDRRVLQEMVGRAGPAFIRRAKLVETTWTQVVDACAKARLERLAFVGLRLARYSHRVFSTCPGVRAQVANGLARVGGVRMGTRGGENPLRAASV
jgi:hypothetical protein